MYEKDVYEAKVKKLMTEYQKLAEELMKKECYYDGLRKNICTSDLRKDIKLNAKEKKLMAKAKKLWKNDINYYHMYNLREYEEISEELTGLQHEVMLVDDYYYSFNELELMDGKNICRSNLVIGKCHGADILLNMFEEKIND